jgi:hypothetical protein
MRVAAEAETLRQQQHGEADEHRGREHAHELADLLPARRRPEEKARLQVLRRIAGNGGGDCYDAPHRNRAGLAGEIGPAEREKDPRGAEQRRDRHAAGGVARDPDQPDESRGHGHEEERE